MGITFSARTEQKQRKSLKDRDMNNQHFNTTMDSQQFFELVEVPQQQQYDYEMDSQGYSPSEVSSDHDLYVPAEDYAPCAAKQRRFNANANREPPWPRTKSIRRSTLRDRSRAT